MLADMPEKLAEIKTLPGVLGRLAEYDLAKELPWFGLSVFGNTLGAYVVAAVTFVIYAVVLYFARHYLVTRWERLAKSRPHSMWNYGVTLAREVKIYLVPLVAFYFATQPLTVNPALDRGIRLLLAGALTLQVVRLVSELGRIVIDYSRGGFRGEDPVIRNTNNNLATLVKIAVWVAGILFFLDNAGFNVSTFIAGLGIGGVAIALAAQAILGDTFSSFAIALDKPFEAGDYITVDTLQGTVEHIGLKTTRVRSVGGELLVFANSDLTKSRIRNFKRMEQRRAELRVMIHPQTPLSLVHEVPELLSTIISKQAQVTLDYAKFVAIADGGLQFDAAYFVNTAAFADFAVAREEINFALLDAFAAKRIAVAFTTNTAVVVGNNQSAT